MDHLAEPAARSVLEQGRHVYVAVAAPAGPHVTPELYSVSDGRVWFWSAHDTVKAKVLAADSRAAAVVSSNGRTVIMTGHVQRFDPKDVRALPRALKDPVALGRATVRFGLRNAADLGAFATDFVSGRLGRSLPPRRVLLGLKPSRLAVVDNGRVLFALGDWGNPAPEATEPVTQGHREAVLAWETDAGPVALPGRVDLAEHRAWVAPALRELADLPSPARAAVVVDDYVAPGPAAKEGTLLRGTGTLHEGGRVEIEPERTTDWSGVHTSTRKRRPA